MVTPQMVLRGAIARTGVRPFPLSLTYEVTWLCNLSCGYCDRHTPMRNELTQEEIFRRWTSSVCLECSTPTLTVVIP